MPGSALNSTHSLPLPTAATSAASSSAVNIDIVVVGKMMTNDASIVRDEAARFTPTRQDGRRTVQLRSERTPSPGRGHGAGEMMPALCGRTALSDDAAIIFGNNVHTIHNALRQLSAAVRRSYCSHIVIYYHNYGFYHAERRDTQHMAILSVLFTCACSSGL